MVSAGTPHASAAAEHVVVLDLGKECFVLFALPVDEAQVHEPPVNYDFRHGAVKDRFGTRLDLEKVFGVFGHSLPTLAYDYDLSPGKLGPENYAAYGRQLFRQVHSVYYDDFALVQLVYGVCGRGYPDLVQKYVYGVVVVYPRPVVDVVGANNPASQLLQQVRLFVGYPRRVQKRYGVRTVLRPDLLEPRYYVLQRLCPRRLFEPPVPLDHGTRQPVRGARHFMDVPAAHAESSPVRGVRHAGIGARYLVPTGL